LNRLGPFDGIFGFSMGGAIASLIAMKPDLFPGLKFVILSGSPDIEQLITLKNLSSFSFIAEDTGICLY
jgi:predicted alpha/beta superfamily hydrolase